MVCRLCLTSSDNCIAIFSEENIRKYIMKFLQLELTLGDTISKLICSVCWTQLNDFQMFCMRIEEAQKSLVTVRLDLKKEVIQNDSVVVNDDSVRLVEVNTEPNLNLLKKEDNADGSDDEPFDASDTFRSIDDVLKFELSIEETTQVPTIAPSEDVDPLHTCRITRGSKYQKDSPPEKDTSFAKNAKRKCVRSKKKQVLETPEIDETSKKIATPEQDTILDMHAKQRRGQPKKGEERPKVVKASSEKSERFMGTAKELDDIIQKNMSLVCDVCSAGLVDFAELERHFRTIHNRKGYAVCCNKRLYKRGLVVDHINTHNNPEYFKCTVCGKVLADRMCLRNHMLVRHQNEDDKPYQCPYCPKKYAKQYLLGYHQVKHVPQAECTFFCKECGRGFPKKSTLNQHLNQIHSTLYKKMCKICEKIIRGNVTFERHMEEHKGIVRPQVQCDICGSWLKDKINLRRHMYKHDGNVKSYSCSECGKSAASKDALRSHYKYVHQTVRQFHCTFCDKSFKKANNLREHLTTHTGEVLYTCPHCPQTFNFRSNMHGHLKKKHTEEWKANRRCSLKQSISTEKNYVE